jgi:quercetin dioxygenase-like cupin family protein
MHDLPGRIHWHEPTGTQRAGFGTFKRPALPYDRFMESEGIPVFRDIGVSNVRNLPLGEWKRMGGRGTFIQLFGTEGKWGQYLVEVPGAGALNPERHMYEEIYLVVEGRGTTEVWLEGDQKRHVFEWQEGSLFSIPLNAWHRIVNATSSPALLLGGTTAPNVINLFNNTDMVFNCPYAFRDRFSGAEDFYKPNDDIEPDPIRGLAMRRTNMVPDIVNCELPLDNRRSPGWRRVEPFMTGNSFYLWIGEHETGKYSKGHAHTSAAVLICVKGKGYTYTWPEHLGVNPWADGNGDQVRRLDYEPIGMVTAAPGGARWYHQHFNVSQEGFRLNAWFGPNHPSLEPGPPGEKHIDYTGMDITEGGTSIPYWMEDPHIRKEFEATLEANGGKSRMDPRLYDREKIKEITKDTSYAGAQKEAAE